MDAPEAFAYLDHNVLDLMTKGDPKQVRELLKKHKFTPVYSDESLKEIYRSKGCEQKFIDLLEEIGAKYIEPILGENFRVTGQARIHAASPMDQYGHYIQNLSGDPDSDLGMGDILLKFYGGKSEESFEELMNRPLEMAMQNLLAALENLDSEDIPEEMRSHIEAARALAPELPALMKVQTTGMTATLDSMPSTPMAAFEEHTGVGPVTLNNISPPNVVQQVWEHVSSAMDAPSLDLETFFGLKPEAFNPDLDHELTPQEKVNAIYHQLNFLGYYRDSNIKKERRFKASFSDMTHAGIAAFCHVFICRDGDLVMKAKAAYEYLGINTVVLFYPTERQMKSDMVAQFKRYAESARK